MAIELKLPDVGDNIEKGTVVSVLVKVGDSVTEGQPIIEIETDKAVVEVPASAAGMVESIAVQVGDIIPIGGTIVTLGGSTALAPVEVAVVSAPIAPAPTIQASTVPASTVPASATPTPAASTVNITLPDVGDNIEKGTVVTILLKVGDVVTEGQPVIEIETDKAVVEVPSAVGGTVLSVNVNIGDSLPVGGIIAVLGVALSVGAGTPAAPLAVIAPVVAANAAAVSPIAVTPAVPVLTFDGRTVVPAAPSIRRLARELGIDIHTIQGTGTAGRISDEDVRNAAASPATPAVVSPAVATAPVSTPVVILNQPTANNQPAAAPLPNFEKWGTVRREDMSGIRKATVRSMSASTSIPMVTQFDKADITVMEEARKRFASRVEKAGGKLTMTHILLKVVANALRQFPKFGASLDLTNNQVIYKDYINLGIAVDTPVGLLVPVLKDADRKSITDMVLELNELAAKARDRKLKPDEMQGATFTISNLGGIGGYAFTPIVNSPEVAILGVSRGGIEPIWNKETSAFEPRNMLPLSLSYDHRLIDGADAARFVRFICESLEDPFLISL